MVSAVPRMITTLQRIKQPSGFKETVVEARGDWKQYAFVDNKKCGQQNESIHLLWEIYISNAILGDLGWFALRRGRIND